MDKVFGRGATDKASFVDLGPTQINRLCYGVVVLMVGEMKPGAPSANLDTQRSFLGHEEGITRQSIEDWEEVSGPCILSLLHHELLAHVIAGHGRSDGP